MEQKKTFIPAGERQQLIDTLFAEQCSCVIRKGNTIRIFRERGVKDLFRLLKEEPEFLAGAFVADKVVGKGAAALMILGSVQELFAAVISQTALELLTTADIRVEYRCAVPHIVNRMQTGICPVEQLCAPCTSAGECLPLIEKFIDSIRNQSQLSDTVRLR